MSVSLKLRVRRRAGVDDFVLPLRVLSSPYSRLRVEPSCIRAGVIAAFLYSVPQPMIKIVIRLYSRYHMESCIYAIHIAVPDMFGCRDGLGHYYPSS